MEPAIRMRAESVKGRLVDGTLRDFRVEVSRDAPWWLKYCDLDGNPRHIEDVDLFRAFAAMRQDLESQGCQLLFAGARPDVHPSSMSSSMGGGRLVYILRHGKPSTRDDLLDIFDYAEPELLGTVQQQR